MYRTDIHDDELYQLLVVEKRSVTEVSRILKYDARLIRKRLKEMGVEIIKNGNIKRTDLEENSHEIERLYIENGLSTYEIAKQFNCSHAAIQYRLKKMGVELRGRYEKKDINNNSDDAYKSIPNEIKDLIENEFEEIMSKSDIETDYSNKVPHINNKLISESTQVLINDHTKKRKELLEKYLEYRMYFLRYTTETTELLDKVLSESNDEINRLKEEYESIINQ